MPGRNSPSGQLRRLTALTAVMVPALVLLLNWFLPMSSRAFGIGTAVAAQQKYTSTRFRFHSRRFTFCLSQ